MRYQQTPYSCGAAAVVNALRCLGKRISEARVRTLAGTTEAEGTDEKGIEAAVHALGYETRVFTTDAKKKALYELRAALGTFGRPVIICTQNAQHWVTVVACFDGGQRFLVVDPANTVKNCADNGMRVLSRRELVKTWHCRTGGYFFGIVCMGKAQ